MSPAANRLAIISATSGTGVGGAEMVLRRMAEGLALRGWQVDFLTSAAESIYTWENVASEGVTREGPLTVRRFRAVGLTQPERDRLGSRILMGIPLTEAEEYQWANSGMRLPGLFDYLTDHHQDYRAIICGPYQFWMCLVLADLCPRQTIVMPCLHDEPVARLDIYRYETTNVRGLWLLTEPERDLAAKLGLLGERHEIIGSAIDPMDTPDVEGFRQRHGIDGDFVLFAGRREWGKGWPQLVDDMAFAAEEIGTPIPLVTCGIGDIGPVPAPAKVIDLGVLDEGDRTGAQAAAAAYIQPSAMESFSRTVLEAFQLSTPVFANDASAVVRWHCARSGAGLTYRNRYELTECLRLILDDPEALHRLGASGPAYVRQHFDWGSVFDRAEATLWEWT